MRVKRKEVNERRMSLQQKKRDPAAYKTNQTIPRRTKQKKIVSEKFEKLKEKCRKEEIGSRRSKAS